jgi:hypothetical protein
MHMTTIIKKILLIIFMLLCETLFGCEWGCFILRCILSLGAVDGRDIHGRGMLWMLGGVVSKFA